MGNSAILSSLSNYKLSTMLRLLPSLLLLLVLLVNIQAAPSPGLERRMAGWANGENCFVTKSGIKKCVKPRTRRMSGDGKLKKKMKGNLVKTQQGNDYMSFDLQAIDHS